MNLDRIIKIRRFTRVTNEFNESEELWADYLTTRAMRRDASAGEQFKAAEINAEISTRFTVRYSSLSATISPLDRVAWNGREYNITAVRDVGRNRWREIDAVVRADA